MRKLFLIIASIFTVLGVVFAFLPLGTLALFPIGIALLFGFLVFQKSDTKQRRLVKILLLFSVLSIVVVVGKEILIKDEVIKDESFEKTKVESENDAVETLENELE